jgi:DNA repair exonuclease SbcCD ATPase subunit
MKPLKLELQAFGPFVERQTVDFEKLSEKGMFLIKGNTGSGKTTIFDAMTFALYGGGSGEESRAKNGRNDLEEWRCTQAGRDLETFVAFTFAVRGKKYLFRRRLIPKRINFLALNEAGEIDEYGNVIPFFENPKKDDLNGKAEELIGLNKEQFRQVVLLPQGQFERFLTASSDDKQGILMRIFDSARWDRYAQAFFNAAKDRKTALDDERREVVIALDEEGVADVDALSEKIRALTAEQAALRDEHRTFDGANKQAALDADRLLSDAFRQMHEFEDAVRSLEAKKPEIEALRTAHGEAERAEALRGVITDYETARGSYETRKRELASRMQALPEAQEAERDAAERSETHEKQSPVAELTKRIGEDEATLPFYRSCGALRTALADAETAWDKAKRDADGATKAAETAAAAAAQAKVSFDAADAQARTYRNRYFSGIYGEIAETLTDGEPCPVCGSVSHPRPAEKTADSVGKDDVEAAEREADRRKKLWERAENDRAEAERRKTESAERLHEAERKTLEAKTELAASERSLIEGVPDEAALQRRIAAQKEQIERYRKDAETLKARHEAAVKKLTALKETVRIAEEEQRIAEEKLRAAEAVLRDALQSKGYPDAASAKAKLTSAETRREMHGRIVSYETSCRTAAEELAKRKDALAGKNEPDAALFEERQKAITAESNRFIQRDAELRTDVGRLERKRTALSEKWRHYRENIQQAESDLAFARKLRGDTGIGLMRYVLAVMFNQVIGEANRMLENVHGGRYRLFRSDEKGAGNKRGLELKVHDARCPDREGRGVGMLSGGEKFLVSLALSIGMSAVAQKSGVQIEALFIDEGFGTLDESSINDAMNVLDSVRRSSGMIGIISHVQILEDNIPTQLHVIKRESGSTIALE